MSFHVIDVILNNQSISAFLGAFFAFLLVALNDYRRDRKKIKNLRAEIEINLFLAKDKLESVRSNRAILEKNNQVIPARIMRFNTALIHQFSTDILNYLTIDQRRAIGALCYLMEEIDNLLNGVYEQAERLTHPLGQAERELIKGRLLIDYGDTIANIKRFIDMCEIYLEEKFSEILTKVYDHSKYRD